MDQDNKSIDVISGESPLVSVVIPCYNHGLYVADAIRSALDQDCRNVEIIVVDDGSTDKTREAVAAFGSQIRYIWQANSGLSAARNTGIGAAKGEYIGVLDADDIYLPDSLSTLIALLSADPSADAVYGGFQFVDMANNTLPQVGKSVIPPDRLYQVLLDGNFLMPESILVRRYCYERLGAFDEALRACEDWDMWLRIARNYRVLGTNRIVSRHRVLPGSMSSDPHRMFENRMAVLVKVFGTSECNPRDEAQRRAYGRAYVATALEYLQRRDPDLAYDCLRKGFEIDPSIAREFFVFYELACGDQPKGFRGDFATVDLQNSERQVLKMLDRLFGDSGLPAEQRASKRFVYAHAYMALGMLSYGACRLREARVFMLRAVAADPGHIFERQLVPILLKSLLGAKFVKRFSRRPVGGEM